MEDPLQGASTLVVEAPLNSEHTASAPAHTTTTTTSASANTADAPVPKRPSAQPSRISPTNGTSPTTQSSTNSKYAVTSVNAAAAMPPAEMRADALIPTTGGSAPQFPVVHPHGFRILNNASAMERNMRGYFRLPQPLNAAAKAEQRRLQRTLRQVESEEAQRRARVTGSADGVVLDGFLILGACEADDPSEVSAVTLQASHLTSSIAEDLTYFTELRTLDVSDNQLRLGDVLPFPGLETVHLVCNGISSLNDVRACDSLSLSTLLALDLAYNRIPSRDLLCLSAFTALQHLDVSNNGLRSLPSDLSSLSQLTHLALEANQLESSEVFHALGTLPSLQALNLARNRLSQVPLLHAAPLPRTHQDTSSTVAGGSSLAGASRAVFAFPALQTITLSENRFTDGAAFLPLAALHRTLRHVAVGGNPFLVRQPQEAAMQLQQALDEAVVDLYFIAKDPAAPPPLSSPDCAAVRTDPMTEGGADTWQDKTWVRYIPPPAVQQVQEEGEYEAEAGEPTRSRASSLNTAAPPSVNADGEEEGDHYHHLESPSAASSNGHQHEEEVVRTSGLVAQGSEDDDVFRLTVAAYMERYHIQVQSATPPPPPAKQPKRFFYSAAFRAMDQAAGGGADLITLPPYEEFMDIYRIAGRQSHAARRKGHPAVQRRVGKANASAPASARHVALPLLARHASTPPPPPTAAASSSGRIAPATRHGRSSVEDAAPSSADSRSDTEEEEEEEEAEGDGGDGFFLTGMNSEGDRGGRGSRRKKRSIQASSGDDKHDGARAPADPQRREQLTTTAPLPYTYQNSTAVLTGQSSLSRPPLPRSVVSPASTNVHTAMSELRAMLRKPLPSLPYEPSRTKQGR